MIQLYLNYIYLNCILMYKRRLRSPTSLKYRAIFKEQQLEMFSDRTSTYTFAKSAIAPRKSPDSIC